MPTARQKKVAKLIVENVTLDKPLNGGEMLEKVSYSKGIQIQPSRVFESEGVKEALADLGFTESNAKMVVSEILLNDKVEPNARLKAADQVFKVHGSYAPEKSASVNVNIEKSDIDLEKLASELAKKLQEQKV